MPRVHLHLRDAGHWTVDPVGVECPDLQVAAAKAEEKARSELNVGSPEEAPTSRALDCSIVVADESGQLLLAVPCYEAAYLPEFEPLRG